MKASQFLVASDTAFVADGVESRVLLHSLSGEVYVLPSAVLQQMREQPATLTEGVAAELSAAGLLVADDHDEFTATVRENASVTRRNTGRSFVLMPSSYCNMGCGYCGQKHVKTPPSKQHRAAVKDRVLHAVRSPETSCVHIGWFGGEPMMGYAQILDISAAAIPACREAGIEYSAKMVTNGSLLTPAKIRKLHLGCGVGQFEITLDGPAARHDVQRPLRSGRPSFDRIARTIAQACACDDMPELSFIIRTNVSRANQDEHEEFAAAMREAGLATEKVVFYTAMVRPWGNDVSEFAVPRDQVVAVERQWLRAYRDHGLTTSLLPTERVWTVCSAVSPSAEVISPTGGVHSCTEQPLVPGREHTALAHVVDLQTPRRRPEGAYDHWNDELLGDTEALCPSCAIFPICGGACPLVWHEGRPACPSLKSTMPMRLTLYGESLGLSKAV
ncbi:uncharacterized protein SAMN05421504_1011507 [Amycolatopsis xylanica]|uniref:Radical SAM core domain-containing protein n=1 Tax=Amycolatopsis xylanica TaxID=589385 RepID=A0A1H2WDP6_9PSEU|nr:radical SAM protein [Amycolatopsis xylanica]SDW78813.1 uncharacterized protein SAMN05421504_1011507 [Amycolatopsis xylanica]